MSYPIFTSLTIFREFLTKRGLRKYTNFSRTFEPASGEEKILVFFLRTLLLKGKNYVKKKPRTSPRLYFKAT